jgi:hypothetical protein
MQSEATDYTFPENRGTCGFCGEPEDGYAKKDNAGRFQAACWPCINKDRVISDQPKRKPVGTVFTEDLDTDDQISKREKAAKKAQGIAPSDYRPKVN